MTDQRKFNKLAGAKVLIFGGTSGIGYGVAEGCVESGCTVHVASSSSGKVTAAVKSLIASYPSATGRVHGHVCALNDKATLEANVIALFEEVGDLDHVIHTAGDLPTPPQISDGKTGLHAATVDDTIAISMVRLFSAQIVAKHAVNKLQKSQRSSITITSGSQSDRPMAGHSLVTSVAAGIHGLARGLALDLAPIRVNAVSPGPVKTPIFDRFPDEQRDAIEGQIKSRTLTGIIAEPEDTAEAYLFLMRDQSCTGSVIRTDSGILLT
jgi:NAD(P)-dependent dehydrogenase (short-subunit alcohol dehydrogenase family)